MLRKKANQMWLHLLCGIVDSVFLALWALPNVGVEWLIGRLNVKGIDEAILRCMQALFGVATLAPICIWIYTDVRIMIRQANKEVARIGGTPPISETALVAVDPASAVHREIA